MDKIVIASGNQHKIEEFRTLFAPLGITVIGMKECGTFAEPEETGTTFAANAVIKAEALCAQLGCTVISDDSGLEIDALNKEPGVYSARYLGHDTSYEIKNRNLIERVSGQADRTCRFVCAIALARPAGRPRCLRERSKERLRSSPPEARALATIRFSIIRRWAKHWPRRARKKRIRSVTAARRCAC